MLLLASSFLWRNIIKHYWTLVSLELECTVFGLEGIQCGGVCILKTSLHCRVYFFLGFCYTKALNIEFDLDYRKHNQKGIKLRKKIEYLAKIYLPKVNNRNTSKRFEMCSNVNNFNKHHWHRSGVFVVNFEHISHLFLVFLLLNLNK